MKRRSTPEGALPPVRLPHRIMCGEVDDLNAGLHRLGELTIMGQVVRSQDRQLLKSRSDDQLEEACLYHMGKRGRPFAYLQQRWQSVCQPAVTLDYTPQENLDRLQDQIERILLSVDQLQLCVHGLRNLRKHALVKKFEGRIARLNPAITAFFRPIPIFSSSNSQNMRDE